MVGCVDSKDGTPARKFTELELGAKANNIIQVLCVVGFVLCLGIGVFVFSTVPLDARLSYSGRFGRNGIPMPLAMGLAPVCALFLWRATRKPDANHMGKGGRMIIYWLGVPFVLLFPIFHWVRSEENTSELQSLGVIS